MKKLYALLVLSLLIIQLFPIPVIAGVSELRILSTLPATEVSDDMATLNASISLLDATRRDDTTNLTYVNNGSQYAIPGPMEHICVGYFQYGTVPGVYTAKTPNISLSLSSTSFHAHLIGLEPCTTYFARAVLVCPEPANYTPGPTDGLVAFFSNGLRGENMRGLGMGLTPMVMTGTSSTFISGPMYGNVISFTTSGCKVGSGSHGAGGMSLLAPATKPYLMSNIKVNTAALSSSKVSPGEKVEVTANMVNQGGSNGDAKVTLYVNGQEVESKGITLAGGENAPVHFYVSRNEPGTYSVYVGGVSAGSFVVDLFTNNDILIYVSIALVTIGLVGILYVVTRKRTA